MATWIDGAGFGERRPDVLSGTPRAHMIDRWIYVFTAAGFIAVVLAGFIPSSLAKVAAVQAGERPPFPLLLHMHAALMGSFLALLFAQTWLMATGRNEYHMRLGLLSMVIVPAIVIVGFLLVGSSYHQTWEALQSAPPEGRERLLQAIRFMDNIRLLQLRIGILFPLFLFIALRERRGNAGLHKRMMILATAVAIPAGIDRIPWLPGTYPESALSSDLYMLLAVSPMFLWDVLRNRHIHPAYLIWMAVSLPFAVAVHGLWDTPWWHAAARQMMGA
jgi:hypothetical protein